MNNNWIYYKYGLDYRGDLTQSKELSSDEMRTLFHDFGKKTLYIRNVFNFDCEKKTNFWYVVRSISMETNEYKSSKICGQIRRSLRAYSIKRVDREEMRRVGFTVYHDCWLRFPKSNRPKLEITNENEYSKYIEEQENRGVEFWVGYSLETGEAAMTETVLPIGNVLYKEQERLSYKYTNHYPTYALNHEIANYYINERGISYIIAGARTVDNHSNVYDFLITKMGFRKAYCSLSVKFRFPLNVFVIITYPFRKLLPLNNPFRKILTLIEYAKPTNNE